MSTRLRRQFIQVGMLLLRLVEEQTRNFGILLNFEFLLHLLHVLIRVRTVSVLHRVLILILLLQVRLVTLLEHLKLAHLVRILWDS